MAEIFRPPYFQVESAAGVPLSGAKLYFYVAGTTTDQAVYQEIGLSTPHTQPVVADASGIFPAIYLGASTYKAVLKTSADDEIKSYDNINATSAGSTVLDGTFRIQNTSDNTKQVAISAASVTAGQTRTLTSPDASGTIALIADLASSLYEATTAAFGLVKKATLAQTLAGTSSSLVPTVDNLYFPTGHLYGLTLTTNGSDATNDIDIAAGTARDATDSYNMVFTAKTKQTDTAWALGTNAGSLDTGSVGNSRYAIWGIGRSDTRVTDFLTSTSFSSPTMPANYDYKVLIGEFTRSGGVNGSPIWYGAKKNVNEYYSPQFSTPVATTSGTSVDLGTLPSGVRRIEGFLVGVSTSGTSPPMVRIGPSGGAESTGYISGADMAGSQLTSTTGLLLLQSTTAASVWSGRFVLTLQNPRTNTWVFESHLTRHADGLNAHAAGYKAISGLANKISLTTSGGAETYDAGEASMMTW